METNDRFKSSPHRRHRNDLEAADSGEYEDDSSSGPFDIYRTKHASADRLRRWRQAALVLNARRRYRYTLDLNKKEVKEETRKKIRAHTQVIRQAYLFQEAGSREPGTPRLATASAGNYGIDQDRLASITRDHDFSALEEFGGVEGLADILKTSVEKGIRGGDDELSKRKHAFGTNTYPRKKGPGFWNFVWDACRNTILIILMIAAAASLGLGIKTEGIKHGWNGGGSIALAVIIVVIVTAVSDYTQFRQFQSLNEEKQDIHLEVVRGGRRMVVSIFDLVVGDVVPLKIGDQVPADGIFISGHSLAIDESSMTGESKIVQKGPKDPFMMSGCKVADGYGTVLVTSVGMNTEWGLLMASISDDIGEETPLQVRLDGVTTFIGVVGLTVAVVVLIVLMDRYFTGHSKNTNETVQFTPGKTKFSTAIDGAIQIFAVAVTIVVIAVPEGLPLAVTLRLAYSMRKMMADKALVRRLSACETMGSATTICSDKTGTLTLNQMTVVEAYVGGEKAESPDNGSVLPPKVTSLLIEGIAQNTTGSVFVPEGGGNKEISGSPTEKAILQWGINLGMNFDAIRSSSSIINVFPFNSEKKRGGVALKLPDSEVHIHWKGAAEMVLASCTRYIDTNDQVVPINEDKGTLFKGAIEDMATRSLRCVAIAYRSCGMENVPTNEEELAHWEVPDDELVLLAIVGLKDPCRPSVKNAVWLCTKAGVKVRMVTGDNLQTAKAVALECGILGSDADASELNLIEGKVFRALSEVQRQEIADKILVMGRSSPNDKLLLVQALRKEGHVVAVTGDGTNDAPALQEADIGLAMGIQGTEVAKESSDIIILDDNFSSVMKVVRWGRSVYANIQKFIQFQLTINIVVLVINVVAAFSSGDVPLNTVELLWVNLIMDALGALALATEPPTDELMHRPPVGRWEPLITNVMWRDILVQALYQVTVVLILNFKGIEILHLEHYDIGRANKVKKTLIFNAFIFCQIFNEFNAREPSEINILKGVTNNYLFMGIVGFTILVQVIIDCLPQVTAMFVGYVVRKVRLSWKLWLVSIAIGFVRHLYFIIGMNWRNIFSVILLSLIQLGCLVESTFWDLCQLGWVAVI